MTARGAAVLISTAVVERREALGPCAKGLARPEAAEPGNRTILPWRAQTGPRKVRKGVRQPPGASRRSILSREGSRKKGYGQTRPPENQEPGQRSVGYTLANSAERNDNVAACASGIH